MKKRPALLLVLFLLVASSAFAKEEGPIAWQDWSPSVFEKAKAENCFVILDLEAVWCHWCHVMAGTTYADPEVVRLIGQKYIAVRVDQDAHPDLSLRYEDWGWPATVVFAPDGTEIVKRRGYIPPEVMKSLLQAIIDDPTPGPSVLPEVRIDPAQGPHLEKAERDLLLNEHIDLFDGTNAGWGDRHKLIDVPNQEWAMRLAATGDESEERMARRTLDAALNLLDPVWGGFFQYSDEADWKSPHYEKIMSIQTGYIRIYALAALQWKDPRYLGAAEKAAGYVLEFLRSPEGLFYTSQDADGEGMLGKAFYALDDAGRRAASSKPRIDTHVYARENGWMIAALASLYDATGKTVYLDAAQKAAEGILKTRMIAGGGFRHADVDRAGPYLGDTLAMGQAFMALYESTGDRVWLKHSHEAAVFARRFADEEAGGFFTAVPEPGVAGVFGKPVKQIDENVQMARWANLLAKYSGDASMTGLSQNAMRYLAAPALVKSRRFLCGILLADDEAGHDPLHVTVVGAKGDTAAAGLYAAALAIPETYRRVEWFDRTEGPMPGADVEYPQLEKPAAFLCTNNSCSLPAFTSEALYKSVERSKKRAKDA